MRIPNVARRPDELGAFAAELTALGATDVETVMIAVFIYRRLG